MPAPIRRTDITVQRVAGEAILHDPRRGLAHVVNESAVHVWDLCDGRRSIDEIAAQLAARYRLAGDDLRGDVVGAVAKFRELQLLD